MAGKLEAGQVVMNTSHSDESARAHPSAGEPLSLAELLALARTRGAEGKQPGPAQAEGAGTTPGAAPEGDPYLRFTCADITCAAPITHFREVLPTLPTTIALPFSPPWMLGLFALHTALIGLIDPAPELFDAPELVGLSRSRAHNGQVIVPGARKNTNANWRLATPESGPTALIIGNGERMLALAVSGVGDLIYARPDEIRENPASVANTRMPATRFCAGVLASQNEQNGQSTLPIVKIDALLDELLAALTVMEAAPHE